MRLCFNKCNAKIGTQGTVAHMFDHLSVFSFKGDDEDAVLEALLEADVDVTDVENEDGMITVFSPHTEYNKTRVALLALLGEDTEFETDTITFIPQSTTKISGEDIEWFEKFMDMLNDNDDVQNVYHNAEM